jgi:acetolactate synthase-1/2/3 large subunit
MPKMSGARFIAETLKGYGVTHVFYVEAILRRTLVEMEKLGISRILTHSEKSAAYMADGYARTALKPVVCMAQSVGAANLAAGLQDPYLAHSPVIAFTGRKAPLWQNRNAYQELDHNPMYEPVTKYNVELSTLEQLPIFLPQALRAATSGCPGPVHIDYLGYAGEITDTGEADLDILIEKRHTCIPSRRPAPDDREVMEAAHALEKAERPVLVVGRGAVYSGAGHGVLTLAEKLAIPVATSVDGKGIIPDSNPVAIGPAGTYCKPCANQIVSKADLVFFIGTNTGDQVTKNWTLPNPGTKVIQLDINPDEIGRNYPGALGILGDVKVSLDALISVVTGAKKTAWLEHAVSCTEAWKQKVEPYRTSDAKPIRPERLCREITEVLPEDAIVVADTGYSAIWAATMINIDSPQQTFLRAAGSLGWAFPAALGAKCAAPDRPVICFAGDGAFWYHLSELETASRWGINTVTVVNNNSALGQCLLGINRAYGDDEGKKQHMYNFRQTNFSRIAEEMGAFGVRVSDPKDIKGAIQKALNQDKPALVEVITEPAAHPIMK